MICPCKIVRLAIESLKLINNNNSFCYCLIFDFIQSQSLCGVALMLNLRARIVIFLVHNRQQNISQQSASYIHNYRLYGVDHQSECLCLWFNRVAQIKHQCLNGHEMPCSDSSLYWSYNSQSSHNINHQAL